MLGFTRNLDVADPPENWADFIDWDAEDLRRKPARLFGPRLDVGPVPAGTTSDGPLRFRQQPSESPGVHGLALHAEPVRDLDDPHGRHEVTVANLLTVDQGCGDNHYMTESDYELRHTCENENPIHCSACLAEKATKATARRTAARKGAEKRGRKHG